MDEEAEEVVTVTGQLLTKVSFHLSHQPYSGYSKTVTSINSETQNRRKIGGEM